MYVIFWEFTNTLFVITRANEILIDRLFGMDFTNEKEAAMLTNLVGKLWN